MRALLLGLALACAACAGSGDDGPVASNGGSAGNGGAIRLDGGAGFPGFGGTPSGGGASSGGADGSAGTSGGGGSSAGGASGSGGSAGTGCPHPPVNDPSADSTGLPPGPIVKYTVHVYYIKRGPNDDIITPVEQNGKWMALVGDKIVFDSTQKNADNVPCQWQNEPEYVISDSCAFERLATGNPFLLQMQAIAPGELTVSATIDGVTSNEVVVEATP